MAVIKKAVITSASAAIVLILSIVLIFRSRRPGAGRFGLMASSVDHIFCKGIPAFVFPCFLDCWHIWVHQVAVVIMSKTRDCVHYFMQYEVDELCGVQVDILLLDVDNVLSKVGIAAHLIFAPVYDTNLYARQVITLAFC